MNEDKKCFKYDEALYLEKKYLTMNNYTKFKVKEEDIV